MTLIIIGVRTVLCSNETDRQDTRLTASFPEQPG